MYGTCTFSCFHFVTVSPLATADMDSNKLQVVPLFLWWPNNNCLLYEIFLDDMKQVSHTMLATVVL